MALLRAKSAGSSMAVTLSRHAHLTGGQGEFLVPRPDFIDVQEISQGNVHRPRVGAEQSVGDQQVKPLLRTLSVLVLNDGPGALRLTDK